MPDLNTEKTLPVNGGSRGKSYGCVLYFFIFLCVWLAGAWGLWQLSKDEPSPGEKSGQEESEGSGLFFEIIPGSDERTSVDDDMADRGRARQKGIEDKTE